ncbi:hypothetical protein GF312_01605, partial [Candidatus Poribacteria bacterium]|nr:hypothetical protein [Candidatus Poribacteria bacterium]
MIEKQLFDAPKSSICARPDLGLMIMRVYRDGVTTYALMEMGLIHFLQYQYSRLHIVVTTYALMEMGLKQ